MRFSCADFAFPLLAHESALDLIALLGFTAVDVGLMEGHSHIRPGVVSTDVPAHAAQIRKRLDDRGLELVDLLFLPSSDMRILAANDPDPGVRGESDALFDAMLSLARQLGAPGMTILPGFHWETETWEESFDRAVDVLSQRTAAGKALGVQVSVEPHLDSIVETPAQALRLAEESGVELTVDYSHFVVQGIPDADIEPLMGHARHFHARGARPGQLQASIRTSTIDWERVAALMRETGYAGYVAMEYLWSPADPSGSVRDMTMTDNVSEIILLRDRLHAAATGT